MLEVRDVREKKATWLPCGPTWMAWPEGRGPPSVRGAPGLSFAKRQPGADLTVFRAATAFATPVEHRIS